MEIFTHYTNSEMTDMHFIHFYVDGNTKEMLVIFTKNGSLATGSHKGAGTAGFFSMPGTVQHLYCTDWIKGGHDQ
jgi:hypothetical protein